MSTTVISLRTGSAEIPLFVAVTFNVYSPGDNTEEGVNSHVPSGFTVASPTTFLAGSDLFTIVMVTTAPDVTEPFKVGLAHTVERFNGVSSARFTGNRYVRITLFA
ncbi:hypothetical protein D3C74_351670 [compost metagenome]